MGVYAYIRLGGYAVRQLGNRQKIRGNSSRGYPPPRKKNRFRIWPAVVFWWYYPNTAII